MTRVSNPHMGGPWRQALNLGRVFVAHHIAPLGAQQQQLRLHLRQIRMDIVHREPIETGHNGAFVAGMQPLRAQLALLLGPGRAESQHVFGRHPRPGLRHRAHIPGQFGRVSPAPRPGNGWIGHHQAPGRRAGCAQRVYRYARPWNGPARYSAPGPARRQTRADRPPAHQGCSPAKHRPATVRARAHPAHRCRTPDPGAPPQNPRSRPDW
ncbi:Uncharacterised protein [Bordetella avium]|nr:Uncharacterised protein [Bordetella avium]